ncbi:MAG TPA: CPBP family intramembrane glutamic endopeptidase [Thermoanaerobaculia bacterium]|nr:CPBP family intramembrane glutamic endopeptidase [Thermoanaerobaculia bacterium]
MEEPALRFKRVDGIVVPLILFLGVYLSCFLLAAMGSGASGTRLQWLALASVLFATRIAVTVVERGEWPIGFGRLADRSVRELLAGLALAVLLVGLGDVLLRLAGAVAHSRSGSMDAALIASFFLPAALHEEILFRGYLLQKLLTWRRDAALCISSFLFTAAHAGNDNLTAIAILNIFLAGLLLGLAYLLYRRLWLPLGIHFGWNVMSGPLLGYRVSGMPVSDTMYRADLTGPSWLSGGTFGVEGSVMMTFVELMAIASASYLLQKKEMLERSEALARL